MNRLKGSGGGGTDLYKCKFETISKRITECRRILFKALSANFPDYNRVMNYREEYNALKNELVRRNEWEGYCRVYGLAYDHDGDSLSI